VDARTGGLQDAVHVAAVVAWPWARRIGDDKMIPTAAQHAMSKRAGATVVEVKASHAVYESQPAAVAQVIEAASRGV
jgi:hypothetical protein